MTRITNIIYKESALLNQLLTDVTFYEKLYESKRINEGLEVLKLFNEAVDVEMGDDPDKKKEWFQHDFHTQNVFGFSVKKKTKEFLNRFEVSLNYAKNLLIKRTLR